MANPSRRPTCGFCGTDHAATELLFVGEIGGIPDAICSACVEGFHDIMVLDRHDPAAAMAAVTAHNDAVKRARRLSVRKAAE